MEFPLDKLIFNRCLLHPFLRSTNQNHEWHFTEISDANSYIVHSMKITEIYSFCESNVYTKENTKELICRNIFSVRDFFISLHCVVMSALIEKFILTTSKIFRETGLYVIHTENFGILLSQFFHKNSVKLTFN